MSRLVQKTAPSVSGGSPEYAHMGMELIVSAGAAIVAMVVFVAGDRLRPKGWRRTDDDAAGTLALDLIKTFFTAVVAFVVVICWQQYQNARSDTDTEANALIDTYWAAHSMPQPEHDQIQGLVREYTTGVVDADWPEMNRTGTLSASTQRALDNLRDTVEAVRSDDTAVADVRKDALSSLDEVSEMRHSRALAAGRGMPGFLYGVLWFGTVLLLLSPVLSGVRVTRRSVLMMALLGVVVGSAVLQIYNLDYPFRGGDIVPTDAFRMALARFQHIS